MVCSATLLAILRMAFLHLSSIRTLFLSILGRMSISEPIGMGSMPPSSSGSIIFHVTSEVRPLHSSHSFTDILDIRTGANSGTSVSFRTLPLSSSEPKWAMDSFAMADTSGFPSDHMNLLTHSEGVRTGWPGSGLYMV